MSGAPVPPGERCPCCGRRLPYVDGTTGEPGNHAVDGAVATVGEPPLFYRCRSCGARWNRYRPGHRRHAEAQAQVDVWPATSLRTPRRAWQVTPVRLAVDGALVDLVPDATDREVEGAEGLWSSLGGGRSVFVVTAWNPGARPATLVRNRWSHRALLHEVRARGWASTTATPHQSDVGWTEQGVALVGVEQAVVLDLAASLGQPAVLEWSRSGLRVVWMDSDATEAPWVVMGARPVKASCTMRAMGDRGAEVGACRNPGGGWTSAAIHESLRWRAQRRLFRETLGCGTCGVPGTPEDRAGSDGVVQVGSMTVTSRYGPARPAT